MADGFRTRVSIVAEGTFGTTPATPTMLRLPVTAHAMADRVPQSPSNIINQTRNIEDMVRVGRGATGSLTCELRHSPSGEGLSSAMFALMSNSLVAVAVSIPSCTTTTGARTVTRGSGSFSGDGIAVGDIGRFESELLARIKSSNAGLLDGIRAKKDLTAELEAELKSVLDAFLKTFA